MNGKLVYLTGIPASGKTCLARRLEQGIKPLYRLDYGQSILEHKQRSLRNIKYDDLRRKSSSIIHTEDVRELDSLLIGKVNSLRKTTNVLIDSHAATKEEYGFRLIPFTMDILTKISLDAVILLHSSFENITKRIEAKPEGRPLITIHEYHQHTSLQHSLAVLYGVVCNCPIYAVDNNSSLEKALSAALQIFKSIQMNYQERRTRRPFDSK